MRCSTRCVVVLAVALSVSMSGCIVVGHVYVSPQWQDPGIYDRATGGDKLPAGWSLSQPVPFPEDPGPWRLSFHDDALNETWAPDTYALSFVRYHIGNDTLVLQFDAESVMAWAAEGVEREAVRTASTDFIAETTTLSETERRLLVDRLMESRKPWTPPRWSSGQGHHHVIAYSGDHRLQALFEELGGVEAFTVHHATQPTGLLPHHGQVTARNEAWAFHFDLGALRLERERDGRLERLWITPDDAATYVVRTGDERSRDELRTHVTHALAEFGRDVPPMDDWRFQHQVLRRDLWGD